MDKTGLPHPPIELTNQLRQVLRKHNPDKIAMHQLRQEY